MTNERARQTTYPTDRCDLPRICLTAVRCANRFVSAVLILFVVSDNTVAQTAAAPTIEEIVSTVRDSLDKLESIHVSYTISSEVLSDIDAGRAHGAGAYYEFDEFAISGDKLFRRRRVWDWDNDTMQTSNWRQDTLAFDGEKCRHLTVVCEPGEDPETRAAVIFPTVLEGQMYQTNLYFEGIGSFFYDGRWLAAWILEAVAEAKMPFRFPQCLDEEEYRVRPTMDSVDGTACWVLESSAQDTLWLDPAKGFAIVQREWRWSNGGPLMYRFRNADFRESLPGLWLPQIVRREVMILPRFGEEHEDEVHLINVCRVSNVTVNSVPDGLFTVEFPKNVMIVDASVLPGRGVITYNQGQTAEDTQQALDAVMASRSRGNPQVKSGWWILLWVNGILVAALVVFLLVRRYRAG